MRPRQLVFASHLAASPERRPVVVVGAGLAGLNCARLLAEHQVPVQVLEASSEVGGRVRSERTSDGFVLDRGFQVLFTAYPALRRAVDLRRLDLRVFDSGAAVVTPRGPTFLRDPLRHPQHAAAAFSSNVLTWTDRIRLARLGLALLAGRWEAARDVPDAGRTAEQELRALGFSDRLIESFFRPFLAGIRLRRDLSMSAAVTRFDLKMLVRGRAALPGGGMQALPSALAHALPQDAVRLRTPVLELVREGAHVRGVRTTEGEVRASAVVLATDGDSAARLAGLSAPPVSVGSTTVYLAGQVRPYRQKLLVLNALPDAFVNDTTLLDNIAPEYAPPSWHLLAAHVLNSTELDDDTIDRCARTDLARLFPHVDLPRWRTLRIVRMPQSQFAQPPCASNRVPTRTASRGLYVAGEITEDSSINGALRSGEAAARAVVTDLFPGK
ncbi:MAG: FAD-dependent oxidoreductase [Chloroflexi bacterium]|nr:FAD-dependent oxidoreductase [Chloroflexota bacterium]